MKLPSGELRKIPALCRATLGTVGNSDHGKREPWKGRPEKDGLEFVRLCEGLL